LEHRPKVIALAPLDEDDVANLCGAYSIALFDGDKLAQLGGFTLHLRPNPDVVPLRAEMDRLKCGRTIR
ncbi:MAG TPA: hypothetical protein VME40_10525, partial [Caulobacteraceae bacterium]|nr:hypothetical protein [Caulobacteraceae bacterium]